MKYSSLFGKTLRETPQGIMMKSHSLLLKGGFLRPLGHGLYSFLPLGMKVIRNLERLIRKEMEGLGGQEVSVPVVGPHEIWKKRAALVSRDMIHFRDRTGRALVLSPTHEEAMVELVRQGLNSYRDLPLFLYQFQTKFRDERRVRGGIIRTKEFVMKDAYSFHRSSPDLNNFFPRVFNAYNRIFEQCQIPIISAEAGVGYMGGEKSYEFLMPNKHGDDEILECSECGYRANREVAKAFKDTRSEIPEEMEKIHTPGCKTMNRLSSYLDKSKDRLAKSMVYKTVSGFAMAIVRGDYEISMEKLSRELGEQVISLAGNDDLEALGLVPGYLSPLNTECGLPLVVDDCIVNSNNLVMGANIPDYYYKGVNYGRDFESPMVADIARARKNDLCLQCGQEMRLIRAIELGNIFKLGSYYTKAMELSFQEESGHQAWPHMGSYGIGLGRLLAAIVESNHDEKGIIWPEHIAPYRFFVMGIGKSHRVTSLVEQIHEYFGEQALMDDRSESIGVKFKDADLLGIPVRVVVSTRLMAEKAVEVYNRRSGMTRKVPIAELYSELEKE